MYHQCTKLWNCQCQECGALHPQGVVPGSNCQCVHCINYRQIRSPSSAAAAHSHQPRHHHSGKVMGGGNSAPDCGQCAACRRKAAPATLANFQSNYRPVFATSEEEKIYDQLMMLPLPPQSALPSDVAHLISSYTHDAFIMPTDYLEQLWKPTPGDYFEAHPYIGPPIKTLDMSNFRGKLVQNYINSPKELLGLVEYLKTANFEHIILNSKSIGAEDLIGLSALFPKCITIKFDSDAPPNLPCTLRCLIILFARIDTVELPHEVALRLREFMILEFNNLSRLRFPHTSYFIPWLDVYPDLKLAIVELETALRLEANIKKVCQQKFKAVEKKLLDLSNEKMPANLQLSERFFLDRGLSHSNDYAFLVEGIGISGRTWGQPHNGFRRGLHDITVRAYLETRWEKK